MSDFLAARLSSLSPSKRALLEKLRSINTNTSSVQENQIIRRRSNPNEQELLSFAQQRLWFLDQLEGPSATYNMPIAIQMDGPVDFPIMQNVFSEIVNRHESLRTNFVVKNGETFQIINKNSQIQIAQISLEGLSKSSQENEFKLLASGFSQKSFNLTKDCLIRLMVIKFSEERHILLLVIHHIVSDGWSNGNVLLREICVLYEAFLQNKPSPLDALPIQYADFSHWQRQLLTGSKFEEHKSYWLNKLAGIPSLLELPTDYSRPLKQEFNGNTIFFDIDRPNLEALKNLCKQTGTTLFMVLQAVFCTLLSHYSRQKIIVIGSPIANRNHKELEGMIGFFVNNLVLRADFQPGITGLELIQQIKETCLEAYEHQDLPFERLVETIKPPRNSGFSPLFQVMFILQNQNQDRSGLKIGDLKLSALPLATQTAMFDITMKLEEQSSELQGELEYNVDLFKEATIDRFVSHFKKLIEEFITNPNQAVDEYSLMREDELNNLVLNLNATQQNFYKTDNICTLFEKQAFEFPDQVALHDEFGQISYSELNIRAAQLAALLKQQGAVPEKLVGICTERSISLVIGLLGILKTGAAYVPIDPSYPMSRIKGMVNSAKLNLILVDEQTSYLVNDLEANVVSININLHRHDSFQNKNNFLSSAGKIFPQSLAYVIFTSGSTGNPKGVQISHFSLVNFLQSMTQHPGIKKEDTFLALTTISFDIAGLELYLPLISGGRVFLAPKDASSNGFKLNNLILNSQANIIQATPTTWRLLFSVSDQISPPVDKILCGGEALTADLAEKLINTGAEIWNLYGPTETTIWSTRHCLRAHDESSTASTSIGKPIANTQIYIFNSRFQISPLGIPGELFIGGDGLSRGYLNQPAITAERFIPNLYSGNPGARIYRTGDLASRSSNGQIQFIGRADFQVKVRGFRIELGEIESIINSHPLVQNSVAVCQESTDQQWMINAFFETNKKLSYDNFNIKHHSKLLENWGLLWEKTHSNSDTKVSFDENLRGWISSYTGKPIPRHEILAWVNEIATKILSYEPKNVLEIGCGSGLLLLKIAPKVHSYTGIEFSQSVIETLNQDISSLKIANVNLILKSTNHFLLSEAKSVDTAIINSVIHFFPNVEYLLEVIKQVIEKVDNGGQIFITDIRSKSLLELQIASVIAHQTTEDLDRNLFKQRVQTRVSREDELMLDSTFFGALYLQFPEIKSILFSLKEESHKNEMNKFRYDVIISIDRTHQRIAHELSLVSYDFSQQQLTLDSLKEILININEPTLIKNIPNARLIEDFEVLMWLNNNDLDTESQLPTASNLAIFNKNLAMEPSEIFNLAKHFNLKLSSIWTIENPCFAIDALFIPPGHIFESTGLEFFPNLSSKSSESAHISDYANNPSEYLKKQAFIEHLKKMLEAQLPIYMLPNSIHQLENLPLTPNGKIDRNLLPNFYGDVALNQYIAPRSTTEEKLHLIWTQVLNIKPIGVYDNFFKLGGYSLMAVQIVAKIRDSFLMDIPLQALFDNPDIDKLSQYIDSKIQDSQLLNNIYAFSEEEREYAPLSFSQKRLWFLDQLEGPNANYHLSIAVEIFGNLDLEKLELAILKILERHEVLRTIIDEQDGVPKARRVSYPKFKLSIEENKLGEDFYVGLQDWLNEKNSKPFDLRNEIPFRSAIYKIKENHFALSITFHHIAADEFSMVIFQEELIYFYESFLKSSIISFPVLPLQYSDYAKWQEKNHTSALQTSYINYWKSNLEHAPALLDLPIDFPRPAIQGHCGKHFDFVIHKNLFLKIKSLALSTDTTIFMFLFSAYAALLAKYGNTNDVVIGTPVTYRNRTELNPLIGFFVNTLPIRFLFKKSLQTVQMLAEIRQSMLNGFMNQDLPFESIVEAVEPQRSLSYAPLFQTMFILMNPSTQKFIDSDLKLRPLKPEITSAKFDLTLSIEEIDGTLQGCLEYNSDLFKRSTIENLSNHYISLIESMVNNPYKPVLENSLLSLDEYDQITKGFNPPLMQGCPTSAQVLFENIAKNQPEAIALTFQNTCLSYEKLNQLINKHARVLRELGVKSEVVVGILFEPCLEMVITMLAILKAGGAYLPILSSTPKERVDAMLQGSSAQLMIYQKKLFDIEISTDVLLKSYDSLDYKKYSSENPSWINLPESLAYIIFTSGSTGTPKGVGVTRENLDAFLYSRSQFYPSKVSSLLLLQPYAFDIASGNIFWVLSQGGTLHLEETSLVSDPLRLHKRMCEVQVSHLVSLPLLYRPLLNLLDEDVNASLKTVILGGEALPPDLANSHYKKIPSVNLINEYGPTETTIMCTAYAATKDQNLDAVPIGKAIGLSQIFLLDSTLSLSLKNTMGEMYIGGKQVSRGYINQASLTAEKFIPNHFSNQLGERLYKTGDFARWSNDGYLQYKGRNDNQVKIRGFRIELNEIENALTNIDSVKAATVLVTQHEKHNRIYAYVVFKDETLDVAYLKQQLQFVLPDYMIPSGFCFIKELPYTANGKLDINALPKPEFLDDSTELISPKTDLERRVAQVWMDVLNLSQVGINDNFFNLGGDSILSIQIVSRLNNQGLSVTVKQLFQEQTIANLIKIITIRNPAINNSKKLVERFDLSPIQYWFFENFKSSLNHFNQSVFLEIQPNIPLNHLELAFEKLLAHHDLLRVRFSIEEKNKNFVDTKILSSIEPFQVDVIDLKNSTSVDSSQIILETCSRLQKNLDIEHGKLIKVALFKMGNAAPDALFIVIHHLVIDGISWRILISDLEVLLKQLSKNIVLTLEHQTSSFGDWTFQLKEYAKSQEVQNELPFWQTQLSGDIQPVPFDLEYNQSKNTYESISNFELSLNEELTKSLLKEVPRAYRTQINDILLSALTLALGKWTSQQDFLIISEGHGREELFPHIDVSRTVGWFTSAFPVRLLYLPFEEIGDTLQRIKSGNQAIPQHGLGYAVLRYLSIDSKIRESLTYQPLNSISFNYLGQLDSSGLGEFILREATGDTGMDIGSSSSRQASLDINTRISNKKFHLQISYSVNLHLSKNIERFANLYKSELIRIIEHCKDHNPNGYSNQDFPLAILEDQNYEDLKNIYQQNIEDIFPLTPMQEGMLFHSQFSSGSGAYIIQMSCEMHGEFDSLVFMKSWEKVINRHPSLRTIVFYESALVPHQVVLNEAKFTYEELDWTNYQIFDKEQKWSELLKEDRETNYQLHAAPLMRFYLIKVDKNRWQFLWSHHHILTDGWSLPIIMKEVLHFYIHQDKHQELIISSPPRYQSYIKWLNEQNTQAAKEFWTRHLDGFDTPTSLGIANSSYFNQDDSLPNYRHAEIKMNLELSETLNQFAKDHRITISTIIQGSWAILLSIYSQSKDIVFGATVSGRPPELNHVEEIVGLFINTLPIRVKIQLTDSIFDFLTALLMQQIDINHYAYTPLLTIQQCSGVSNREPLFKSILVFENYPMDSAIDEQAASLKISNLEVHEQTNFPLTITASNGAQIPIKVSYDSTLIQDYKIDTLLQHLECLLGYLCLNPNASIRNWMGSVAAQKNLEDTKVEKNNLTKIYPDGHLTFPDLFEKQVNRMPDAIAFVMGNIQISYSRLNQLANQFAHQLIGFDIKPGDFVGVCLDRSPLLIISLLGIQKLGAVYIPIDPDYPISRIHFMLNDSNSTLLISNSNEIPENFEYLKSYKVLKLNLENLFKFPTTPIQFKSSQLQTAYVIYTSGSTGNPKGVKISQGALVNFLLSMKDQPGLNKDDAILSITTISLDIAGLEIYLPLISGARIVFADQAIRINGQLLNQVVLQHNISVMQATPTSWQMMIESGLDNTCLDQIWCGGEAFPLELAEQLQNYEGRIWNLYGPTETTIWSAIYQVNRTKGKYSNVPIGLPIANTLLYLEGFYGDLVPEGLAGELLIGGKGLADGYHNLPGLTAEKFIPNAYDSSPGSRLYLTGDIAISSPQGIFSYLRRMDRQIKIGGVRIELGEIDSVIQRYPQVKRCLVKVQEINKENQRLTAFLVPESMADFSLDDLQIWIKDQLPSHMVPKHWVLLEAFPLTPNGKLDTKALIFPTEENLEFISTPKTATEEIVAVLIAEVLKLQAVDVQDDFFDLGGHSLLATRLVTRINQKFKLNIPLPMLFKNSTTEKLATYIDNLIWSLNQKNNVLDQLSEDEEEIKF